MMNKQFFTAALVFVALNSAAALAEESVAVYARAYTYSCGYYSSSAADVHVTYQNDGLPWGSKVAMVWGFNGKEYIAGPGGSRPRAFEWAGRTESALVAIAPNTWRIKLDDLRLNSRSSRVFNEGLDFVLRITLPDGSEQWVQGSDSSWGFYRLSLGYYHPCLGTDGKPDFEPYELIAVTRS